MSNSSNTLSITDLSKIKSRDELLKLAEETEKLVEQDELKTSIYLYTITRYMVSVYEAHSYKIPIQIWNEFRNSLDHMMRYYIITPDASNKNQLKASESHLLRACLDIIKLFIVELDDWYVNLTKSKLYFTYALVDNGDFLRKLEENHASAQKIMVNAKTADLYLGNNSNKDKEIVSNYLDAYFAYNNLRDTFMSRKGSSIVSKFTYKLLFLKANFKTAIFSAIGKLLASILIFISGLYFENIKSAFFVLIGSS